VDPSKFNVDICYNIAGKVFRSNLSRDPVARSIREDLIQEAVKSMWEKSGLLKETKKYSINYQYYFVARNYMNSYLSKWKRQMQYNRIIEDLVNAIKQNGKRVYHPMFGWMHY
jgi:deoxyadenosine/deoxycytidine kinase